MQGPVIEFEAFVLAERQTLLRVAYLLCGDHGHAEDLVQAALISTYAHWHRVIRRGDPSAYVRRALVNKNIDRTRRAVTREHLLETIPETGAHHPNGGHDATLLASLRGLPPRMRAVVVLRFYEDRSEADTARVLGCSIGTVKSQSSKALARIRDDLTTHAPTDVQEWLR